MVNKKRLKRVYIYITFDDGTEVEKEIRSVVGLNKIKGDMGLVGELIRNK